MRTFAAAVFVMSLSAVPMMCAAQVAPVPAADAPQPRIYVTDSNSWTMAGGGGGGSNGFGGSMSGGAAPQTAEIIKTFGQRCPQAIVNNHLAVADYVVELDHEGGKGMFAHKDKVAVFVRKSGDSIFSESTLSVGGSVQDACKAITTHWGAHAAELAAMADPNAPAPAAVAAAPVAAAAKASISVTSTPAGADITINEILWGTRRLWWRWTRARTWC